MVKSSHLGKARDLGQNSDEGGKVCRILHRLTDSKTVVENFPQRGRTREPCEEFFRGYQGWMISPRVLATGKCSLKYDLLEGDNYGSGY